VAAQSRNIRVLADPVKCNANLTNLRYEVPSLSMESIGKKSYNFLYIIDLYSRQ
jgi:hypothetical protein